MLKALILSLIIATTAISSNTQAATQVESQQQADYTAVVKSIGEARVVMVDMIGSIGHRSDRELATVLFKRANQLYKTLGPVPTQLEVAKINNIIANFEKIEILFKMHYGKRYIEI